MPDHHQPISPSNTQITRFVQVQPKWPFRYISALMHNAFITQWFDWNEPPPRKVRWMNAVLRALGFSARLTRPHATGEMTCIEQRINIYHLLDGVLTFGVSGDIVEIGASRGSTAALLERVVSERDPKRQLHVFDAFVDPPLDVLMANFQHLQLRPPVVHAGWLDETIGELPEQIAFAHIDLGPSKSPADHERLIEKSVAEVYARLSPGGVCVLADYWVASRDGSSLPNCMMFPGLLNHYPQVKRACDCVLADKPERMIGLFAGEYAHGYFRKLLAAPDTVQLSKNTLAGD